MMDGSEYHLHAEECRALATLLTGEARAQLMRMAETWERLGGGPVRGPSAGAGPQPSPPS